jgi:Cof subfamily protein (haloacid dehalogenase superfamily)
MDALVPYRLLAIDLDGTLLTSCHQVSEENIYAIQRAQDMGLFVVLVSARPPFGIQMVLDKILLDGPLITYNGAYVMDIQSGEIYIDQPITKADTNTAMEIIRKNNLYVGYYAGIEWYVEKVCEEMRWERRALKRYPHVMDLTDYSVPEANKLIVADLQDSERLSTGYENMIEILPDLNIHYSGPHSFEVTHREASKGRALEFLSNKMNISRESMVAIGDNYNDLEMFSYAGTSVAMGNAPEAVRAAADWVVASNDVHGVAQAISRVLKGKE